MANITCYISGLTFECPGFSKLKLSINSKIAHPIFSAPYESLYSLYSDHCKGRLNYTDSYLLFLAFLNSSGHITWKVPATLNPTSSPAIRLVENNISQLLSVLEQTNVIQSGSFTQPAFVVSANTSNLEVVPNWIEAWKDNLYDFKTTRYNERQAETLQRVQNELSYLILSGAEPKEFSDVIARWANRAAGFPPEKVESWCKTITSCFDSTKMFKTPLAQLKELKEYCLCNISADSIHFFTLLKVLNEGIARHIDYLGGSKLALGYELLPSGKSRAESTEKTDAKLESIIDSAPTTEPSKLDFESHSEYIKAKLAYSIAKRKKYN